MRPSEKATIAKAARLRDTTLTKFILDYSIQAAQRILADQVQFTLSHKDWIAFCQALDAPPRVIPKLRDLLSRPSVFEKPAPDASN
jgi:uncharacterized protein (DUF1778 family)